MSAYVTRFCNKHGDWNDDIDCPGECPECMKAGEAPSQRTEKELESLRGLLRVAKCPQCDGRGWYVQANEQIQCQWCDERNALLPALMETDNG